MGRMTEAVKHLLIINVILFFATQLYGDQMYQWMSLWFPKNNNFEWWQVVTHMFMHGNLMHIVFNMYALWAFGTPLEQIWGKGKFLFFYFSAGLGSAALHTGVNYFLFNEGLSALEGAGIARTQVLDILSNGQYSPGWYDLAPKSTIDSMLTAFNTPAVGASGAIYGILVAFAFMYSEAKLMLIFLPVPIKAKYFVPILIAVDLIFGIGNVNTGVAHFAHIGGALIGFIMMWYWKKDQFNNKRWD
ncbi:rhomboid family intramembrane serine protease [Flagellimonas taeanensis]|uniref:Membrane associated serine protease, rhomboid family n=1 Tax=Flagellimonas taeanensis TaxID=1005926 RepID=A0A1M6S7F4_9FLAO|nr:MULTISPECIES: rhomboid family intramembrane serine protease [Allomuricauda]MDC6384565.1 rhomboid family intramembrane serine protease [Muricauda sp. SK9]MEE1962819.1 rhomboid family intramembrane serine protease [Allomuricauda taeanensis]RIV52241.1 rhomboid family intramembrane serine protease [Allomuricauda taeanensis]SFB78899.1 Membrane associated serine protease, rhomboid family [Allomuricauda taeanensis]SHK40589.1 Membrane associated serine protease, rhomboid family [Allomuricauda taean